MDWQGKLISLYLFICNDYKKHLWSYCERMTNHADLSFSDEEVLTIFLYGVMNKRRELKEIYQEAERYLKPWFPKLPSYVAFVQRINRVCDVFVPLIESLQSHLPANIYFETYQLIDSMPIVMAKQGRRFKAKVAKEIATSNGYCATKKMHYYGVKLHVLGCYRKGKLPIPTYIGLTNAGMGDRKAYEQILPELNDNVFADKAYQKENRAILQDGSVILHTPVKKQKGQKLLDSADKLLSSSISSIRQPIESFFNWLEEKTSIQMASKVRSYNGLMVHVFGRIAAAFFMLVERLSGS
jgi:hypothetical protein